MTDHQITLDILQQVGDITAPRDPAAQLRARAGEGE